MRICASLKLSLTTMPARVLPPESLSVARYGLEAETEAARPQRMKKGDELRHFLIAHIVGRHAGVGDAVADDRR